MYRDGTGTAQNRKKAIEWYTKASELGDSNAQYNLADMYFKGLGTAKNYEKAILLYTKSAEQGHYFAPETLAKIYSSGIGVQRDQTKADYWQDKFLDKINLPKSYAPNK